MKNRGFGTNFKIERNEMNKLTQEEIEIHIQEPNRNTGVKGITREYIESIDLDEVPDIVRFEPQDFIRNSKGESFRYDKFTPRSGSYFFKPSFGGSQILMGKIDRELYFSDGRWFV